MARSSLSRRFRWLNYKPMSLVMPVDWWETLVAVHTLLYWALPVPTLDLPDHGYFGRIFSQTVMPLPTLAMPNPRKVVGFC